MQNVGFDRKPCCWSASTCRRATSSRRDRPRLLGECWRPRRQVPGVARAGVSAIPPMSGMGWNNNVEVPGGTQLSEPDNIIWFNAVTPGMVRHLRHDAGHWTRLHGGGQERRADSGHRQRGLRQRSSCRGPTSRPHRQTAGLQPAAADRRRGKSSASSRMPSYRTRCASRTADDLPAARPVGNARGAVRDADGARGDGPSGAADQEPRRRRSEGEPEVRCSSCP